jgi:hypothetical protein
MSLYSLYSLNENLHSADIREEFFCPEESQSYSQSLAEIVLGKLADATMPTTIIEFGSGTGDAIVAALTNGDFNGIIHGYEINPNAARKASDLIQQFQLSSRYTVHPESLFDNLPDKQARDYLIANPPYIPCKDRDQLILPDLCGGIDGNDISKRLLALDFKNVFLEICSYADPVAIVQHAEQQGYKISDFRISLMPIGVYSQQDIVQKRLAEMREAGQAFYTPQNYLVGSALFTKISPTDQPNLSQTFLQNLTSIGRTSTLALAG